MKTILVATDFSDASVSACRYAVSLAQAFHAKLFVFHAYQTISVPAESLFFISPHEVRNAAIHKMEDGVKVLEISPELHVATECKEGPIAGSVLEKAIEIDADLIITGMKTDQKGIRKAFGSTVTALLKSAQVPVIVVPESAGFREMKTIALAVESDVSANASPYLVDAVRLLAERFHSHVFIVRVFPHQFGDAFRFLETPVRLIKMLRTTSPVFESISGEDVVENLLQFIENKKVDILAVLTHRHSWIERLFSKSVTKQLAFVTHIPLLVIPEKPDIRS